MSAAEPAFVVETGDDPWPVTLRLAAHLREVADSTAAVSAGFPEDAHTIALCSDRDARSLTLSIERGRVALAETPPADASLELTISYTNPLDVSRHRVVRRSAGQLPLERLVQSLLLPLERPWTELAGAFWAMHRQAPHMPETLRVTAADGETSEFGNSAGATRLEITGPAAELADLFRGRSLLTTALVRQTLCARGTWESINAMNAACQREGLGR